MKKSATIIMGKIYDAKRDRVEIKTKNFTTIIQPVKDFDDAKRIIRELVEEGVGNIELCGAFGKEKARELIELTDHKVGISYVVTDPDMKPLVDEFYNFK